MLCSCSVSLSTVMQQHVTFLHLDAYNNLEIKATIATTPPIMDITIDSANIIYNQPIL